MCKMSMFWYFSLCLHQYCQWQCYSDNLKAHVPCIRVTFQTDEKECKGHLNSTENKKKNYIKQYFMGF